MSWLTWPWRMGAFWSWYIGALVWSSLTVLRDNLTPGQDSTPGIARVETHCRTDAELTLLGVLITLSPGTLTLGTETRDDVLVLYVHGMYVKGPAELRAEVYDLERRMLRAIRRTGSAA